MNIHLTTFDDLRGKSVTDLARKLIKDDNPPDDMIHVFRMDEKGDYKLEPDLIVNNIGKAAEITIKENAEIGPVFVKYTPYPEGLKGTGTNPGPTVDAFK